MVSWQTSKARRPCFHGVFNASAAERLADFIDQACQLGVAIGARGDLELCMENRRIAISKQLEDSNALGEHFIALDQSGLQLFDPARIQRHGLITIPGFADLRDFHIALIERISAII